MNRQEYLEKLRRALAQMPPGELEKQIAYYDELISDMCEDGMSETEAVAKLGDPAAVAAELLTALPLGTLVKSRVKSASGLSGLTIALLVLGFPLWFPLLVSFGAVLLSLLVTLWSLVLSFAAVVLSLGVAAIAAPFALVFGYVEGSPLMIIGASLAAAGLCVLGAAALPLAVRGSARLCRAVGRGIKSIFIKKEK
jgi:uncharacterized membrane protein